MESLSEISHEIEPVLLPVDGGHMMYRKCMVLGDEEIFIKARDDSLFTNPMAAEHTYQLLKREADVYGALRSAGFPHLPPEVAFVDDALYMSAQRPEAGWRWELPVDPKLQENYVKDILAALGDLEKLPASLLPKSERKASMIEVYEEGWDKLKSAETRVQIREKLDTYKNQFYPHVRLGVDKLNALLASDPGRYLDIVHEHLDEPRLSLTHFDARQSNVAWHPELGVSIVDWSWASSAPAGCDRTMFAIDLFKSGYESSDLMEHVHAGHALLQIGHWLARSIVPAAPGDTTVRFHQLASAVSAATLIL